MSVKVMTLYNESTYKTLVIPLHWLLYFFCDWQTC